jgi:Na+/melibiose symporter-like transporter
MVTMTERERARIQLGRTRKFWSALALLVGAVLLAGVAWGYHRAGMGGGGQTAVLMGIGVGLAIGAVLMAWKMRPWDRRWQAEPDQARRDRLQAKRSRILWAFPTLSVIMLVVAFGAWEDVRAEEAGLVDYLQMWVPVLYAWVVTMVVMGWDFQSRSNRKYLDDELTGALRARALGVAFVVLMAAGTAALGVSLWRPDYSLMALVTALTLGGAAAGLRFAWLDHEAGLPEQTDG